MNAMYNNKNFFSCLLLALLSATTACSQEPATGNVPAKSTGANNVGEQKFDALCSTCHLGAVKKAPHKDMIGLMTPEAILNTLTHGIMKEESASLSPIEKASVAEFLAGTPLGTDIAQIPLCAPDIEYDSLAPISGQNWGLQPTNTRFISAEAAGLTRSDLTSLKPRWTVGFPGANRARSQPTFAGGLILVGSHDGLVYALDEETGCQVWSYRASGEVRTGIVVGPASESDDTTDTAYFGDVLSNVYALDARSGKELWRMRADDHPNATITGTPSLHNGNLFIPVSSLEVSLAIDPEYACCTFRGSVLAVDAGSGEALWKTFTIQEPPTVQKQNAIGTDMIGPSGAVVWNSPAIDATRNQLYFGTGENMSSPATKTSDALFAVDLDTGKVNWIYQATFNDAWNVACDSQTPENCPEENGPDFDFGGAAILVSSQTHGDLLVSGQKSGWVHALDPSTGELVWHTQVGRGGIQGGIHFGMAAAHGKVFAPVSDMPDGREYDFPDQPGMHALDVDTGEIVWSTIHENKCRGREFCDPGISQVPTIIGDMVFAGGMDGIARAYDVDTGEILWRLDTTGVFTTTLGASAQGGSFGGGAGPIAFNGTLLLSSGYGIYLHMPGNLLLNLSR